MRYTLCSHTYNVATMFLSPEVTHRVRVISLKLLVALFTEIKCSENHMEPPKRQMSQGYPEEEQSWRNHNLYFKLHLKAILI